MKGSRPRVAFIFTHRIQYFVNVLDELHRRGNLSVLALYQRETRELHDVGFQTRIDWDNRRGSRFGELACVDLPFTPYGPAPGELAAFDPHVVHLNGYAVPIQWRGWLWARSRGLPWMLRGDGDAVLAEPAFRTAARSALLSPMVKGASVVFYQGLQNKEYWRLRGAPDSALRWIPCVSDGEVFRRSSFRDEADRQVFRSRWGAGPEDLVLIVSGKLEDRKRPQDAVDAYATLWARGRKRIKLWFLGSGPLEASLGERARRLGVLESVTLLGFRNQSEMPGFLQAADVLVHPSEKDPWPYAILEGAISGLGLVLSDVTGSAPDWTEGNPAAMTFACRRPDELVSAIEVLVDHPEVLKCLRDEAVRKALGYTEAVFCDRFEAALESVLAG